MKPTLTTRLTTTRLTTARSTTRRPTITRSTITRSTITSQPEKILDCLNSSRDRRSGSTWMNSSSGGSIDDSSRGSILTIAYPGHQKADQKSQDKAYMKGNVNGKEKKRPTDKEVAPAAGISDRIWRTTVGERSQVVTQAERTRWI